MPIMTFMTRYYHNSGLTRRRSSVTHQLNKILHLTIFALAAFIVTSCLEKPTKIGNSLLPGSDFVAIKSIDTLSARSYTSFSDSVRTDSPATSFLGTLYDSYFGTTTAEFVSQLRLGGPWDDQPFVVDSVKLFLHLLDVKGGGVGIVHKMKILEIADEIYTGKPYYSNTRVDTTGYEVADIELPQLKPDTINDIQVMLPGNGIEFGNYILRDTTQLFYSTTKPDFRAYFKGLLFQMEPDADPLLLSLSVAPNSSGYYSNYFVMFIHDADGIPKQYYLILDAVNLNASFNKFNFNFSTATAPLRIRHINDGYLDTLSYVQSMNGAFTKISLPGLADLKSDSYFNNIAVNRAKLIVPVYFDGIKYIASTVPSPIYIRYQTTEGNKYLVPDFNLDSYHSFYDGTLDSLNTVYNFNLAEFVQRYFNDTADTIKPELELFLGGGTKNVLLKANSSKTPVKFEFTYTKF